MSESYCYYCGQPIPVGVELSVNIADEPKAILDQQALFDHADFQKSFVKALGANEREASLLLEGITCAACIWLNEQHLACLSGVTAVDINYTSRQARVRWDETRIKLSEIFAAIAATGYRAYPYDAAKNEEISKRERRDALWRLWVAGFGMMQVMMYAYPVYIANGDMTADVELIMRWASLLLTVPVALGVGAAFVASCWATLVQSGKVGQKGADPF